MAEAGSWLPSSLPGAVLGFFESCSSVFSYLNSLLQSWVRLVYGSWNAAHRASWLWALEKGKPLHLISRVGSKELGWEGLPVLSLSSWLFSALHSTSIKF